MKRILSLITIISIFAVCLSGCDNNSVYESYIEEVKNGYLGGCTNVTVDEVFSETLGGKWSGYKTDSSETVVEYSAKLDNNDLQMLFTIENENIFKVSSIKGVNIQTDTAEDIANVIQNC